MMPVSNVTNYQDYLKWRELNKVQIQQKGSPLKTDKPQNPEKEELELTKLPEVESKEDAVVPKKRKAAEPKKKPQADDVKTPAKSVTAKKNSTPPK